MKKTACLVVGLLVLAPIAFAGDDGIAEGEEKLKGTFVWVRDDGESTGDLDALFEETGAGKWNVTFHFTWEDEPRVWSGTAEGSLTEGDLRGTVVDDQKKNTYKFTGSFEAGKFQGTHVHVGKEGKESPTGTLTLGR